MDWDKTKSLTIVFLLLLDTFLGLLIFMERDKYIVDARRATAIETLLNENDIHLKTPMPRSYPPMRQLSMNPYVYDEGELLGMFLPGQPVRTSESDKDIYISGECKLTIQNGYITFECPTGVDDFELSAENALSGAQDFLNGMGMLDFKLDSMLRLEDGSYKVLFCQKYKDVVIYTNFIAFYVTERGVTSVDCIYSKPQGYVGDPADICAVDEALLHFMLFYKDAYKDQPAEVLKIDLVYYQKETSVSYDADLSAAPHYRIEVEGFERPFLINAYFNRIEQF